jgi:hypothetical protein
MASPQGESSYDFLVVISEQLHKSKLDIEMASPGLIESNCSHLFGVIS